VDSDSGKKIERLRPGAGPILVGGIRRSSIAM
jgi:hypothetical protein